MNLALSTCCVYPQPKLCCPSMQAQPEACLLPYGPAPKATMGGNLRFRCVWKEKRERRETSNKAIFGNNSRKKSFGGHEKQPFELQQNFARINHSSYIDRTNHTTTIQIQNAYWLRENNTTEPTWFKSHLRQETRHTQHGTESMTGTMTENGVRRGTPQITMNSVISEPSPESFVGGGRPNNEVIILFFIF